MARAVGIDLGTANSGREEQTVLVFDLGAASCRPAHWRVWQNPRAAAHAMQR